jgi:hypothetical protein
MTFAKFLNEEVLNAQEIFYKKEKMAWDKFESVRDAKYSGKGSREVKRLAIAEAKKILDIELKQAENEYAKSVGAI